MKLFLCSAAAMLLSASVLLAAPPGGESKGMDNMKSLVGTWKGTDAEGNPITISYRLVSDGSTLMETLDMGEHKESMVTMYHGDNEKTLMTHYCSMGNQPTMKLESSKDGKLTFSFVSATNLKSADDPHMQKLIVTIKDDNHFSQEWVSLADGKETPHMFSYERVQ